mmetsp:Transcript_3414/g.6494  ORF Transcript_3414/g.6494 Transcript_3414/m.6494 type:complete len:228 (-) Transcript_3414:4678-5361(-)
MQNSSRLRKSGSENEATSNRELLAFIFLIQATACICGSMQRAKREDCVVRIPFWILSSSPGKPSLFHFAISTSSVSRDSTLKLSFRGISFDFKNVNHSSSKMRFRKSKVNAPIYDRNAAPMRQSPTNCARSPLNLSLSSVHRFRSEPKPPMSRLAASNRLCINAVCSCNLRASAWPFSNFSARDVCISVNICTSSLICLSSRSDSFKFFSNRSTSCRLGSTFLAIEW